MYDYITLKKQKFRRYLMMLFVTAFCLMMPVSEILPILNTTVTAYAKRKRGGALSGKQKASGRGNNRGSGKRSGSGGGSRGKSKLQPDKNLGTDLTGEVNDFNEALVSPVTFAGAVVLALGIIYLITAFSEQNMQSKMKGSLMLAGGICLLCIKGIYKSFGIKKGASSADILKNVLTNIGAAMTFVGAILVAYALIQLILSYINTNSEEKVNGAKGVASGIAFLCGSSIMKYISSTIVPKINNKNVGIVATKYAIKTLIGSPATYVGAILVTYGMIMTVMGFKNEDAESKHQGNMTIIAGIALLSFWQIFKRILPGVAGVTA